MGEEKTKKLSAKQSTPFGGTKVFDFELNFWWLAPFKLTIKLNNGIKRKNGEKKKYEEKKKNWKQKIGKITYV